MRNLLNTFIYYTKYKYFWAHIKYNLKDKQKN